MHYLAMVMPILDLALLGKRFVHPKGRIVFSKRAEDRKAVKMGKPKMGT